MVFVVGLLTVISAGLPDGNIWWRCTMLHCWSWWWWRWLEVNKGWSVVRAAKPGGDTCQPTSSLALLLLTIGGVGWGGLSNPELIQGLVATGQKLGGRNHCPAAAAQLCFYQVALHVVCWPMFLPVRSVNLPSLQIDKKWRKLHQGWFRLLFLLPLLLESVVQHFC